MNKENMSAQGGKTKKLAYWASVTTLGIVLGVSLQFVKAWTEPTATAPNGNVGAPINSSSIAQTKAGALVLNTAGAPSGLLVANGNVGIGTLMPNSTKINIIDTKDVWVRDANSGSGAWASSLGGGSAVPSGLYGYCGESSGSCRNSVSPAYCSGRQCACSSGYTLVNLTTGWLTHAPNPPISAAYAFSCLKQ